MCAFRPLLIQQGAGGVACNRILNRPPGPHFIKDGERII